MVTSLWSDWYDESKLIDPATGKYKTEQISALWPWYKSGEKVDLTANAYPKQIDFMCRDFYYQTIFPEHTTIYDKTDGKYKLDDKGRRVIRKDHITEDIYTKPTTIAYEDCAVSPVFLKSFVASAEDNLFWLNGGRYYRQSGTLRHLEQVATLRPGNQETWGEAAKLGSRPVSPYMAESAAIYAFMSGLRGIFLWDANRPAGPAGQGAPATFGDVEYIIKGMHRLSAFNKLFDGKYYFIRPNRCFPIGDKDHPIIRGIVNGQYLLLAMTNSYLDLDESQKISVWYEENGKRVWFDTVTLKPRRTHLFQCKLPARKTGYKPENLRFKYTCQDGNYRKEYVRSGSYESPVK